MKWLLIACGGMGVLLAMVLLWPTVSGTSAAVATAPASARAPDVPTEEEESEPVDDFEPEEEPEAPGIETQKRRSIASGCLDRPPELNFKSTVRVLDSSGAPAAGTQVQWEVREMLSLCDGGHPPYLTVAQTGREGEATVDLPNSMITILAERGREVASATLSPSGAAETTSLVLSPGDRLKAKILDDRGQPLDGVQLRLGLIGLRRTTDEKGTADFGMLPAGDYFLDASADGFSPIQSATVSIRPKRPVELTLSMARGVSVTIRVRHENHERPGARVQSGAFTATTDDAGVVRFSHMALGPIRIQASWKDDAGTLFEARQQSALIGDDAFVLDLKSNPRPKPCTVSGQAVDDDGAPIAGARVSMVCFVDDAPVEPGEALTSATGNFEVRGAEAEACQLDLLGESKKVSCPGTAKFTIAAGELRVEIAGISSDPNGVDRVNRVFVKGPSGIASRAGLPAVFKHLPAGSYEVWARTRLGFGQTQIVLKAKETRTVALPVQASGWTVKGRVLDSATGQPVALAAVAIVYPGGLEERDTLLQTTDDSGNFRFEQVLGGFIIYGVRAPGHAPLFGRGTVQGDDDLGDLRTALGTEAGDPKVLGYGLRVEGHRAAVSALKPGSVAEKAGLKIGDLVLSVDGLDVTGFEVDEVVAVHAGLASRPLILLIRRGTAELTVRIPRQ